ncbi:endonuclease/exonuclease/phosphatase family protein [Membranihabitans maritimus]|uniref:endonuclease/exonuclease/phosphatase family protein n=1 Tax=Membranihabitans maritimus TaxID=2904244 RepID=UPI001F241397|nr:endonuclease/exonuclease/phosphatase family protein [Membranihabitans maritimus]
MRIVKKLRQFWLWLESVFQLRWLTWLIGSLVVLLTGICVIQPEIPFIRWISTQTVQILLTWLVIGVGFLLLRAKNLSFVSLAGCGILCLFLKNASNITLNAPDPVLDSKAHFTLLHMNMSAFQENVDSSLSTICDLDKDILIFQEFTPQWFAHVKGRFDSLYNYSFEFTRMDDYGQMIYSKYPIIQKDTFFVHEVPVAKLKLKINEEYELTLLSHYNLPPLTDSYKQTSKLVFGKLSEIISQTEEPLLYAGTLNYVAWDNEMVKFRYNSLLRDSRRGFFPSVYDGRLSIFDYPVDHIFYNQFLDCIQFKKIENSDNKKIGIRGEYQMKTHEQVFRGTDSSD